MRVQARAKRAYGRMEPGPGERFEIDWGHFGALSYQGHARKLYAFGLAEGHSRKMYLGFTHSQSFETFVRCHIHAFQFMGGIARELWFDNLATAVAEHDGNLVRFHPRFLAFAGEYDFVPRACHVRAAWEKGKIERACGYTRTSFWPLRTFADLADINAQARQWLKEVANQRRHRETGQTPAERFPIEALRPLPALTPDYRDTVEALVHRIFGCRSTAIVTACRPAMSPSHDQGRCLLAHHLLSAAGDRLLSSLLTTGAGTGRRALSKRTVRTTGRGATIRSSTTLDRLVGPGWRGLSTTPGDTDRSLARRVRELLALVRDYGPEAVAAAVGKAHAAGAFRADYVANILHQQAL